MSRPVAPPAPYQHAQAPPLAGPPRPRPRYRGPPRPPPPPVTLRSLVSHYTIDPFRRVGAGLRAEETEREDSFVLHARHGVLRYRGFRHGVQGEADARMDDFRRNRPWAKHGPRGREAWMHGVEGPSDQMRAGPGPGPGPQAYQGRPMPPPPRGYYRTAEDEWRSEVDGYRRRMYGPDYRPPRFISKPELDALHARERELDREVQRGRAARRARRREEDAERRRRRRDARMRGRSKGASESESDSDSESSASTSDSYLDSDSDSDRLRPVSRGRSRPRPAPSPAQSGRHPATVPRGRG